MPPLPVLYATTEGQSKRIAERLAVYASCRAAAAAAIAGSCEEPGASGTGDAGPRGPRRRKAPATASCSELTRMDAFARDVSDYAGIAEAAQMLDAAGGLILVGRCQ